MKAFGWIAAFVGTMIFSAIFNGYALSVLWGWFIVKTFSLPALTIPTAIGVAMVVSYLTVHLDTSKEDNKSAGEKLFACIIWAIVKPSFALAMGWIVIKFV